jgi:S-adenosylmethionine decarboxylase
MFITDERVILKTCGTTRLLMAIECVRDLAKKYAGMDTIANVFYSRKNFVRPELQPAPHRSFDSEVAFLDEFFEDGSAYCMGSLKEDRWYLYCADGENTSRGRADHTLEVSQFFMGRSTRKLFKFYPGPPLCREKSFK